MTNFNPKLRWNVVIVNTGEVVGTYRNKGAAYGDIPRLNSIYLDKLEIKKIE